MGAVLHESSLQSEDESRREFGLFGQKKKEQKLHKNYLLQEWGIIFPQQRRFEEQRNKEA